MISGYLAGIVLLKYRIAIFVNGYFWHGHTRCKYLVWPQNNAKFWKEKIEDNVLRDRKKTNLIEDQGWIIIVIWECELKKTSKSETLNQLKERILEKQV